MMIYFPGSYAGNIDLINSVKLFLNSGVKNKLIEGCVCLFGSHLKTDPPSQCMWKSKFLQFGCFTGGWC